MGPVLQKQMTDRNHERVIIGLGKTGVSVARHFCSRGMPFIVADTRDNPSGLGAFRQEFPETRVFSGALSEELFVDAKQIIVSPGVDTRDPAIQSAVAHGAECYGDIELFANANHIPVVAITGSNGKSTVTQLVTDMACATGVQAYAGGNIGRPALEILECDDAELFVLELSSFQLESTRLLRTRVSTVLNVSADHMDRHETIERYSGIKAKIYSHAACSVINRDDKYVTKMKTSGVVTEFGMGPPVGQGFGLLHQGSRAFLAKNDQCLFPANELAIQGESGILNALAALAIGDVLGLSMEKMLLTLASFKGLPHRLSWVGKFQGIAWYNDSKGTNIGATVTSLRSLKSNIVLLAGGVFKGGNLDHFRAAVAKHAKHVILLGQDADLLQEALHGATQIHSVDSMRDAVIRAQHLSVAGDKVLLSPACSSFDMYEDYSERGKDFENCVRELAK